MGKQFADVNSKYGAPMGRREYYHPDYDIRARLYRVKLDSGGYDDGGAYWGIGKPLYCCEQLGSGFRVFIRASSRKDAGKLIANEYPDLLLIRPV